MREGDWHPDIRRELLPGPSAQRLAYVFLAVVCVTSGLCGFMAVMIVLDDLHVIATDETWPVYASLALFLLGALLIGRGTFSPLGLVVEKQARQERAAGYTTQRSDAFDVECPVDVVDASSRRVIRLAGEPLVESKYDVDRVNQIRDRTRQVREAERQERARVRASRL